MNRSLFSGLWHRVFRQGNPLYFLIGINVLVFLALGLAGVFSFLRIIPSSVSGWTIDFLALPASFSSFVRVPWTLLTYMFTQQSFFHLLFNMLWLFWLGQIFLSFLNPRQLLFTYLAGGLTGGIIFLIVYATIPVFNENAWFHYLIGSSAGVSAVVFAAATLVPDYSIRMLFLGNVKLKYLALAFLVLDIIGVGSSNAGGSIAHIGGALMGFLIIRQLQNGDDWSLIFQKRKKSKLRVYSVKSNENTCSGEKPGKPRPTDSSQEVIDRILDKISLSGYDSLSQEEKEALFRASKEEKK